MGVGGGDRDGMEDHSAPDYHQGPPSLQGTTRSEMRATGVWTSVRHRVWPPLRDILSNTRVTPGWPLDRIHLWLFYRPPK